MHLVQFRDKVALNHTQPLCPTLLPVFCPSPGREPHHCLGPAFQFPLARRATMEPTVGGQKPDTVVWGQGHSLSR